jgi:malate dehydrogenase
MIARGLMLGANQRLSLRLLDIEPAMKSLGGLKMELEDCAFALLDEVVVTFDAKEAFTGADVVIMCGAFPRKPGMERKDLLEINAKIFKEQGGLLKSVASPDVRVLVVGNPANTNALIALTSGGLNPKNVSALTRLDHNRALAQVALTLKVPMDSVKNVVIWGNHSGTQVPDVSFAVANGAPVQPDPSKWGDEFKKCVQQRGATVMNARGLSSAASAAKAIVDHVHDWILGTPEGTFVSMAVHSNGNSYGVPDGLIYSFPVTCKNGVWTFVDGLTIPEDIKGLMQKTTEELLEERSQAGVQA